MMKKINSHKSLQKEKMRLKKRQKELELQINANWHSLKDSVQPNHIAGNHLLNILQHSKDNVEQSLSVKVSQLAALAAQLAFDKLEEVLSAWLKRKK